MVESAQTRVEALLRELKDALQEEARMATAVAIPVTLTEAADRLQVPRWRVEKWYHRDLLRKVGAVKSPGPGGEAVLVDLNEVAALVSNPPKPGPRGARG